MSEYKPRDVVETCEKLMDIIPYTEVELHYQVRKFYESLANKAPEIRTEPELWLFLGNILNRNIESIDLEWQRRLVKLFNNQ